MINNKGKKRKGGAVGREAMLPFLFLVFTSNPEFKNASNDDDNTSKQQQLHNWLHLQRTEQL